MSRYDDALAAVDTWPVGTAAVAVVGADGLLAAVGPLDQPLPWASVTKVLTATVVWLAWEEGTVDLDEPAGPPGATLRHLLAHAAGLAFDSDDVLGPPGKRRAYSNRGIELAADLVAARAGMSFGAYLREGILEPLGLRDTILEGSPAAGATGPLRDLVALAGELVSPRLLAPDTVAAAASVAFPGLAGVLPGFGRQVPNDWGLGVEVRGDKQPHWTAAAAPPQTFGHFGQAGSFLWVDPTRALAGVGLADRDFGAWAAEAWPRLHTAVLAAHDHS